MSSTRSIISPPVFAKDATTVIPPTPVAGVSYRDPAAGPTSSADGWPYAERVNSAEFNQIMFQLSSLISILDTRGVLGWSSGVDYTSTSVAWGSDGALYIWLQASGPSGVGAKDPVSEPTYWALFNKGGSLTATANGSFTVPAGVTSISISGVAGGAGGGCCIGGSSQTAGPGSGGGAGQSVIDLVVAVTPGQVIPYTIGAAGAGAINVGTPATNGGNTTVGTAGAILSLTGGTAGISGSNAAGTLPGPNGGAGFPAGGDAMDSIPNQASVSGSGASTPFGGGGQPSRSGSDGGFNGKNASGFGSSGSGASGYYAPGVGPIRTGGNGAPGLLTFKW